jgi:hypothetical protein
MGKTSNPKARFRVGDWVSFLYGTRRAVAQVVEDRGPLGVKGRRLYGIRLEQAPDISTTFEMPEELLESTPAPKSNNVNGK